MTEARMTVMDEEPNVEAAVLSRVEQAFEARSEVMAHNILRKALRIHGADAVVKAVAQHAYNIRYKQAVEPTA